MRLSDFKALTFDCYGTLIDWETGIPQAMAPWLARHGVDREPEDQLQAFARHSAVLQAETPSMLYPEVLANVLKRSAEEWGVPCSHEDAEAFGRSVPDWPAFPDSPDALAYLKRHYRLGVLSNVDRGSFAGGNARLGVAFDWICTAQDIGSYKPDPRNFAYLLEHLAADGVAKADILHVAQSPYHDHVPGKTIGLTTCWIDRGHGWQAGGATLAPPAEVAPDFRFDTLAAFADAHRAETAG